MWPNRMLFWPEKAGNRPKAAIKRMRRLHFTTPRFSVSACAPDFFSFLPHPSPEGGVVTPEPLGRATIDNLPEVVDGGGPPRCRYAQVLTEPGWTGQPPRGGSVNRIFPTEASHMLLLKSSTAEGSTYQEMRSSIWDHSASVSGSSLTATTSSEMSSSPI